MAKHSKEQIIQLLQNMAKQLGQDTLSKRDVSQQISVSNLRNHFGSLGNALDAAGLVRLGPGDHLRDRGNRLSDDDLFHDLLRLERQTGKEPNTGDVSSSGKFSTKPYKKRFGGWSDVLAHYRKWKSENPGVDSEDIGENGSDYQGIEAPPIATASVRPATHVRKAPTQFYGEPIDFRGLRHAPINEQGVVFLFGMVSRELGFNIEAIQQGFPDCEGKYLHDNKKNLWAKARIEFEYRASSFKEHGHDSEQCDFIVCWVNDWPDCPINVIELKSEILKLRSN